MPEQFIWVLVAGDFHTVLAASPDVNALKAVAQNLANPRRPAVDPADEVTIISERGVERGVLEGDNIRVTSHYDQIEWERVEYRASYTPPGSVTYYWRGYLSPDVWTIEQVPLR